MNARLNFGVFKSGAMRMLSSYAVGFVTQGVYFVLIARTLQASEFGLFAGAMALVSVMSCLVGAGAGNVLVLESSRDPSKLQAQMGTSIVYVLLSAIPFALIAGLIGLSISPSFFAVLLPLIVSEVFTLRLFDLAQQVFQAKDQLGKTAICGILAGLIRVLVALGFALFPLPTAAQWSIYYSGTTITTTAIVLIWAVRTAGRPEFVKHSLQQTWKVGVFFSLGTASRTLYSDADKFILSSYGFLAASGSFSAASKILTMASAPIQALVYSLNTKLFRAGVEGSAATWNVVKKPLVLVLGYGTLVGIFLAFASPLVPILLGASYQEASSYLWCLAPLVVLNGIHYLFGDALMGLGRQAARSIVQFAAACLAVVANIVLIPIVGPVSVIYSALGCSFGLAVLMCLMFSANHRREKRPRHSARRPLEESLSRNA